MKRRWNWPHQLIQLVGLNPVIAYMVVNAGHNDALVGLAVLVGVLCALRDRRTPATLAFTAAALIKATAGLALPAYLAWLAYRRGPRALVRPVVTAAAVTMPILLLAGFRDVFKPVLDARDFILPHSPWTLLAPHGVAKALGYGYESYGSLEHLATYGNITAGVAATIFVLSRLRDRTPIFVVAGALLAFLFTSVYTAVWYLAWVLPVLALRWRWRVSVYALGFFALLMIDDRFGHAVLSQVFAGEHSLQVLLANSINTLAMLAAIAGLVVLVWSRKPDPVQDNPPGARALETTRDRV